MKRLIPLLVLVVAFACNKGEKGDDSEKTDDKPAEGEKVADTKSSDPGAKTDKGSDEPKKPDGDDDDDEDGDEEPADGDEGDATEADSIATHPVPGALKTQLGFQMSDMKFLGWTEDGSRFVIKATYGSDDGEMGGSNLAILRQVHDAMTGAVIESFQVSKVFDSEVKKRDKFRLAWNEAKPRGEFKAFTAANTLVAKKPALKSPDGAWTLSRRIAKRTIPLLDKFEVKKKSGGFSSKWTVRNTPDTDKERELVIKNEGKDQSKKRPRVSFHLKKGKESWQSLKYNLPWREGELLDMADQDKIGVEGQFNAYWSPDGKRLLWIVAQETFGLGEEANAGESRFYIRAVGPQVKVVDAGTGSAKARTVAVNLDNSGVAVTHLETAKKTSNVSKIYYRGKAAKAVADKAAETAAATLSSKPSVEEIKKGGWIDVIVFLGGA